MKQILPACGTTFLILNLLMLPGAAFSAELAPNTLSPAEKKAGWRLLFDGKSPEAWRGFRKDTFPTKGWEVKDGWLVKLHKVRGGDLISKDTWSEFELRWDWKISPKGNNGIKYFIIESRGAIGHEYQMMDDPGKTGKGSTASYYDVLPAIKDKPMKPPGETNHSRIVVDDGYVEHWLNGKKVLEYQLGSERVLQAVANSKFKKVKGFGTLTQGHIVLTDHADGCHFQNIKIRDLSN